MDHFNENDLVQVINKNLDFVKSIAIEQADKCAGSIRSALECAVKLFWLKKYARSPVWVKGEKESFDLYEATTDRRFSECFSKLELSDMHAIRQTCNDVLHGTASLTLDEAKELLYRLEKCVKAIERAIPMQILPSIAKADAPIPAGDSDGDIGHSGEDGALYNHKYPDTNSEQNVFWNMLQCALDENGNPFIISPRSQYATIDKGKPNSNLCLCCDFLLTKRFFRIGIYIQNDKQTPCFDRLYAQKDEIERKLGFKPIWNRQCQSPNTRRIETRISFTPYDRNDYKRLIDESLPIFMQYKKVFSDYLPGIFENVTYPKFPPTKSNDVAYPEKKLYDPKQMGDGLVRNLERTFGTKARDIYVACCKRFGWDKSKGYLFGPKMLLYAEGASPEGYSPWFVAHSDWTEDEAKKWRNIIYADRIEEIWKQPSDNMTEDMTLRIVFAKRRDYILDYKYVFLGIYKPEEEIKTKRLQDGEIVWVKTFRLISDKYPQKIKNI